MRQAKFSVLDVARNVDKSGFLKISDKHCGVVGHALNAVSKSISGIDRSRPSLTQGVTVEKSPLHSLPPARGCPYSRLAFFGMNVPPHHGQSIFSPSTRTGLSGSIMAEQWEQTTLSEASILTRSRFRRRGIPRSVSQNNALNTG